MITLTVKMIFAFLRSRVMAGIVCVLCCIGAYHCFVVGLSGQTVGSLQQTTDKVIRNQIAELERRNPEAAAELAKMRADHDHVALAATLQGRQQHEGLNGLARLAEYRNNPDSPQFYDLRLADFVAKTQFVSRQQRSDFIYAHGIPMQAQQVFLNGLDVPLTHSSINDYFHTLEQAAQDNNLWNRVRDNPMMVFLLQQNVEPELLDFYDAEKDWMDDVLFLIFSAGNADDGDELTPQSILQTLKKSHPHFKNALNDTLSTPENDVDTTVCTLYALFANYGDIFRHCIESGFMSITELINVVFANQDWFDKHANLRSEDLAKRLITIRDSHPAVWKMAKQRPLYLELYDRLQHDDRFQYLANSLSEKYGHDDIATFLFAKYDVSVQQAATAVDKFGDVAIYILNRYADSEIFQKYLQDNNLGVRIIPYVFKFEDRGLDRLSANQKWLDRYFNEDGTEKEKEWWVDVPGGAAVNVAQNWANGHPNEWSDLGWAAVDVATAVSIPFTLGGSIVGRGGVEMVKFGSKTVSRTTVANIASSGGRTTISGMRASAQRGTMPLFQQALVRQTGRQMFLSLAVRTIDSTTKIVVRIVQTTASFARAVGATISSTVRNIRTGLSGLAPTTRQAICRGLFASGMTAILYSRTIPMVKEQWSKMGGADGFSRGLANMLADLTKTVAGALVAFFDELLNRAGIANGNIRHTIAYFSGAIAFGAVAVFSGRRALFSRRRFVAIE